MDNTFLYPKTRIILALDCEDRKQCFSVMDKCFSNVDTIKVNYPLILKEGIGIITDLKKRYNKPILADFKIADAPVTNNRIAVMAQDAGADAIMVHAIIGTDAIFEIKRETNDKLGIIIVTELTHPGGLEFTRNYAEDAALLCLKMNCLGIQAPGTRPEQIKNLRNIVGKNKLVVSCGVGFQGGDFNEVIEAGADYAIIGRLIYLSENPNEILNKLLNHNSQHNHSNSLSGCYI